MLKQLFPLFIILSCSMMKVPINPDSSKDFSSAEIINANELLSKIFDQEMAPLKCVPDTDEAALLLRTLTPRMETVQDDFEATLDDKNKLTELIESCDQNCTCHYLDELIREHLVTLDKSLLTLLEGKKKQKDLNSCLNYLKETFCHGDLYKALNAEKDEFSYDEESP